MDWNNDPIILIGPVGEDTLSFENSNYLKRNITYPNLLADGASLTKKRLVDAGPENRYPIGGEVIIIGYEAPLMQAKATYVEIRGGCSEDHGRHREIIR